MGVRVGGTKTAPYETPEKYLNREPSVWRLVHGNAFEDSEARSRDGAGTPCRIVGIARQDYMQVLGGGFGSKV